jgi:hypothetical protein
VTTLDRYRSPADLGATAAVQLRRDGFLVIDSLIDRDEVERIRSAYDDIISQRVRAAGDRRRWSYPSGHAPGQRPSVVCRQ